VYLKALIRVLDDFLARGGHAGRVGQRQIALIGQLLGGCDRQFARGGLLVVDQRSAAQALAFVILGLGRGGWHGISWMRWLSVSGRVANKTTVGL